MKNVIIIDPRLTLPYMTTGHFQAMYFCRLKKFISRHKFDIKVSTFHDLHYYITLKCYKYRAIFKVAYL